MSESKPLACRIGAKAAQHGGNRGADVGAEDDRDALSEVHHARGDESDHQDRGDRGRLNDRRDACSRQCSGETVLRHSSEGITNSSTSGYP